MSQDCQRLSKNEVERGNGLYFLTRVGGWILTILQPMIIQSTIQPAKHLSWHFMYFHLHFCSKAISTRHTHTSQMLRYFGDLHCRPPRNILWTVDCRFADVNPLHCFLKASFRSLSNPIHTALKHSCSWSLRITASRTKLQETKITATRPEATDW